MTAPAKPKIGFVRKALSAGLFCVGASCIFVLHELDIVMNATHSLEEPAYLMINRPVLLSRGSLVSAQMPAILRSRFGDMHYVKRVGGLPGDEIVLDDDGNPCIGSTCYPPFFKHARPISPVIAPGKIPDDHYALFGTSDDSLDSRYAIIGLIPEDQLIARGWPLPFMSDFRGGDQ